MKHFLLITAVMTASLPLQATVFESEVKSLATAGKTFEETRVVFELKNKSKRPLWIALANGNKVSQIYKVEAGKTFARNPKELPLLDVGLLTQLAVYYSDPVIVSLKEVSGLAGHFKPWVFIPKPNKLFEFEKYKTIYLTWDEANYARPQTGPLGGRLGKTDSGLSLQDNVASEDINERP